MELQNFPKKLAYRAFVKHWHDKNTQKKPMAELSKLISADWNEYKIKHKDAENDTKEPKEEPKEQKEPIQEEPKSEPESDDSEQEGVFFEFEDNKEGVFIGSDDSNKAQESQEEPANVQVTTLNDTTQDYERLTNRIHKTINSIVMFLTWGKISLSKEDIKDLDESGAFLAQKYDTKGWFGRKFPETFYILTLISVILRVGLDYLKLKKQEEKETPKREENAENAGSMRSRVEIPPAK